MTSPETGVILAAVRAGLGRGLLPMRLGEGCAELVRLDVPGPALVRTLNLHMHPDTVQAARVQAVVRWLRECSGAVFGAEEFANAADFGVSLRC